MVFGGGEGLKVDSSGGAAKNAIEARPPAAGVMAAEDSLDAQDLLVEISKLRRQLQVATEKERRTQEENEDLKRQAMHLQQQQKELLSANQDYEAVIQEGQKIAKKEVHDVEGALALNGVGPESEEYLEAKAALMAERLDRVSQRALWLQVQAEQAQDLARDANRRQVDAERAVRDLMQRNVDPSKIHVQGLGATGLAPGYLPPSPSALATGSEIWKEDKAFVEGLPKSIPSRAARCASLVTSALANGQSMRSTVGRTVATSAGSGVAPTARPGNVWATLMNGGAAGASVNFA